MKKTSILALALMLLLVFTACSSNPAQSYITSSISSTESSLSQYETPESQQTEASIPLSQSAGQIYLYGEMHGIEKILDKELEIWSEYYHKENMRHLFVELPYYTAEFLNSWMQSDNDDILDTVYNEWEGTASYNPFVKDFYKKIKSECPQTVFHGTDVGHQYNTTGKRFLEYLSSSGLEGSAQYLLSQDAIEQGQHYYDNDDDAYRENKMAENFIREFDKLSGENIMGIYGGAHIGLEAMDYNTHTVPSMANQLKARYDDAVHSEDLAWIAKDIEPSRTDTIIVNEKEYVASYFGKQDLSWLEDYSHREFWRLENAYNDFKDRPKTGDVLPYDNYLMLIETGQVFVIDYTKKDGSVVRVYHRSDGNDWEGMPSTEEFTLE